MDDLLETLIHIVCLYTAKALLPVLSLGYLRVLPKTQVPHKSWWGEHPFQRLPQGGVGVSDEFAVLIGMVFWVAVAIGIGVYLWA